jgi:hypothetical protein
LIADLVVVSGIPNSPKMVVRSVDEGAKLVTAVWFSECGEAQCEIFPAGALDRVVIEPAEEKVKAAGPAGKKAAPAAAAPTGAKRGRKPKQ